MRGIKIQERSIFSQKSATAADMQIFNLRINSNGIVDAVSEAGMEHARYEISGETALEVVCTNKGEGSTLKSDIDLKTIKPALSEEGEKTETYTDTANLITGMSDGTTMNLQLYQMAPDVYLAKYYTYWENDAYEYTASATSLRLLRVTLATGKITLGTAVTIATASTSTTTCYSDLLAAINEGKTPNDFLALRGTANRANRVTTYAVAVLYMNVRDLKITSTGNSGAMAWTTLGTDLAYEFNFANISMNETMEELCAYITMKDASTNAVVHKYFHNRVNGLISQNVTADAANALEGYVVKGACDGGKLLVSKYEREEYTGKVNTNDWKLAYLDMTTGELEEAL